MNQIKQTNTKPTESDVKQTTEIVAAIVSDFIQQQLSQHVTDFVLKNYPSYAMRHRGASSESAKEQEILTRENKRNRKQRPRGERLTSRYHGSPDDFEIAPTRVGDDVQSEVKRILAMTETKRSNHYSQDLRLNSYTHEQYRWFATLRKNVVGTPIRRFFKTLEEAVTWLEIVRERLKNQTLRRNIPLGGANRKQFHMSWETKGEAKLPKLSQEPTSTSFGPKQVQSSNGWTAERRADQAATLKAQRAFRSVDPNKQQACVRPRASTAQILAGAYVPPMPGNNICTATENGSTAAVAGNCATDQPPSTKDS